MKRLILLAVLTAGTAIAQNADISGAQLISGDADSALQRLAREAATSNRKLIISAPEYWHEMILEQVRKGGGDRLQVEVRDSFAEAVMVRSDALDASAAPALAATPAATPVPAPAPAAVATPAAPAVAQRPAPSTPAPAAQVAARPLAAAPAPAPAASPVRPPSPVAQTPAPSPARGLPAPAPIPATPAPARPLAAASPAALPSPPPTALATPAPAARTEDSAQAQIAAIRRRLEVNLNAGAKITRTLLQSQLEPKDVLYVRDPVILVQRRDSLRSELYWLEGGIELLRVELRELGPNRYQVVERIRDTSNPRLRAVRNEERELFVADDPAKHGAERQQLERRYNGGEQIIGSVAPTELSQRDVIYFGDDLSVVVRVNGLLLERYWLIGRINLGRAELLKDGNNKYRVMQDIRQ